MLINYALEITLALAATCAPQGGGGTGSGGGLGSSLPASLAPRMQFAAQGQPALFDPFADPRSPAAQSSNRFGAAGAADFDGDGTNELWFVSTAGPDAGQAVVAMGRGANLGRFRQYPGSVTTQGNSWTDGCSYGHPAFPKVLLVGPNVPEPRWLTAMMPSPQTASPGSHVREQVSWSIAASFFHASGGGTYEIESLDPDGDLFPDVATLTTLPLGGGAIGTTVRFETDDGSAIRERSIALPLVCDTLRLGDFDGDQQSDFALHIPGIGVAAFVSVGNSFRFVGGVPLTAPQGTTLLRDLTIADTDGDARDELLIALDDGVLVFPLMGSGPWSTWLHHIPTALRNPAGTTSPLAGVAVVQAYGGPAPDVVAVPANGAQLVIHPWTPSIGGFIPPVLQINPDPAPYAGLGPRGESKIVADIDGDGDDDLVAQAASGRWWAMQSPLFDLRPLDLRVAGTTSIPAFGIERDHLIATLPTGLPTPLPPAAPYELEVALFTKPTGSASFGLAHSERFAAANQIAFDLSILRPGFSGPGLSTSSESLLSVHLVAGNQRFASKLLHYGGPSGGNGSAIGIRWRLVVVPPLSAMDEDLLPWN